MRHRKGDLGEPPSVVRGNRGPRCGLTENGAVKVFADLVVRRPRAVLAVAGVLAVVAAIFGWQTPGLLGRASNDFVAKRSESLRAESAVERASGISASPQLLVLVRGPTNERLARVGGLIRAEPLFPAVSPALYSRDRTEAVVAGFARAGISQREWRQASERVAVRLRAVPGTATGGPAL